MCARRELRTTTNVWADRTSNGAGAYSFSVGVRVPCRRETFAHWLTFPAPRQGERNALKISLDNVRPYHPGHHRLEPIATCSTPSCSSLDRRAEVVACDRVAATRGAERGGFHGALVSSHVVLGSGCP